jgi:hypothetical protein
VLVEASQVRQITLALAVMVQTQVQHTVAQVVEAPLDQVVAQTSAAMARLE